MAEPDANLPGADIVARGLAAHARGETTIEALLIAIGAPRLRRLGLDLRPDNALPRHPEMALYRALGVDYPADTHSRYNALIRRLVSFERAYERRNTDGL